MKSLSIIIEKKSKRITKKKKSFRTRDMKSCRCRLKGSREFIHLRGYVRVSQVLNLLPSRMWNCFVFGISRFLVYLTWFHPPHNKFRSTSKYRPQYVMLFCRRFVNDFLHNKIVEHTMEHEKLLMKSQLGLVCTCMRRFYV